jgi:hypothetical protein
LQAREQLDLPPNPDTTAPLFAAAASIPGDERAALRHGKDGRQRLRHRQGASLLNDAVRNMNEPDLPARVAVPALLPPALRHTALEQDVVVRCLTQKQQKKSEATFHYRPQGAEGDTSSECPWFVAPRVG